MVDLMNTNSKDKIIKDFYSWLFDKENIDLIAEPDLSLYASHVDHNLYYPKEFEPFFNSKAMQRLGKINQLCLIHLSLYSDTYHTRLEHSKGAYYRKLEELIMQTQDEDYKKYIEDNNKKIYLIAELLKMAGHDIGHPPLSHLIEQAVKYKGFHEEIGKRILTEDSELIDIYNAINPKLHNVMIELLSGNPMNFNEHDESNYDVDRFDYLQRDALYSGRDLNFATEKYNIMYAKCDEQGNILTNADGSIVTTNSSDASSKRIDVYNYSSLHYIEAFLFERLKAYKHIYCNEKTNIQDRLIRHLITILTENKELSSNELVTFLSNIKNAKSADDVDINEYTSWHDLRFLSNCMEIAENSNDEVLKKYIACVLPNLDNLINFSAEALKEAKTYTNEEINFLKKLKFMISDNGNFSRTLRAGNSVLDNTTYFYSKEELESIPEELQQYFKEIHSRIYAYKSKEPIFIKDTYGKVYTLDKHPNRMKDWDKIEDETIVYYAFYPKLKLEGVSDDTIKRIKEYPSSKDTYKDTEYRQYTAKDFPRNNSVMDFFDELEA